jgi:hypothetical protein
LQKAQYEHARTYTSADAQTTKPKQTYAQILVNSDANAITHLHSMRCTQKAQTENIRSRADEQTTKPKMLSAQAKPNHHARINMRDTDTNYPSTSLLGRPSQLANSSVQTDRSAGKTKPKSAIWSTRA